jgi:hypothetical protein
MAELAAQSGWSKCSKVGSDDVKMTPNSLHLIIKHRWDIEGEYPSSVCHVTYVDVKYHTVPLADTCGKRMGKSVRT